jgi:hypothetical protein
MNEFCFFLNLPFNLDDVNLSPFKIKDRNQVKCSRNLIDSNIYEFLSSYGISVPWLEVFYLSPRGSHGIHCDGHEFDNKVKLNYIIGGTNSEMIWYNPIDKSKVQTKMSPANTRYLGTDKDNVTEIFRSRLTKFNAVNVGILHDVNNTINDRYCISIALEDSISNKRLDIKELENRLRKFIP